MSRLTAISGDFDTGVEQPEISACSVVVKTPNGNFEIGVDNDGDTYVSVPRRISLQPVSSNRVILNQFR